MAFRTALFVLQNSLVCRNPAHEDIVTVNAIVLQGRQILCRDPNRLRKILKRKGPGMVPPVPHLGKVFGREFMRDVAIIARRNGMVT